MTIYPLSLAECPVVIADDNRDAADTLAMFLEMVGANVRVAYDGLDALRAIQEFSPPVAFLDIGMPGLTGYEVARALRQEGSEIFLVAVTGWGAQHDLVEAFVAGFDLHITKPANPEEVEAVLKQRCLGATSRDIERGLNRPLIKAPPAGPDVAKH